MKQVITWWGTFDREELKKFLLLAGIFAFTIGVYWLMRSIKDSVFSKVVGADNIPLAKWVSLAVIIPLVIVYGKLVDAFPRHRVFYALCTLYAVAAFTFTVLMLHPTIGLGNTVADPSRIMGWAWYVFVESFGSIMVVLFWSFAADTTTPESAKKGYSIIAMGAQLGGLSGPLFVVMKAREVGTALFPTIAGLCMLAIAGMVWLFMRTVPATQLVGYHGTNEASLTRYERKADFFKGLRLVLSQPYLLGIFSVLALYEIIITIFDFHFKVLADQAHTNVDALTQFFGEYGVYTNGIALLSLVLGIGNIGRAVGLIASLMLFPIALIVPVIALNISPTLRIAFWIMVGTKALNYAFNQPAKEQLYIPTTKETRYKAKAWIDMFGSRGSKATGSAINLLKKVIGDAFLPVSTIASLGFIGIWLCLALYLGRTHRKAIDEHLSIC